MSEFNTKNNYLIPPGYPIDPIFFEEIVYKLISIFGSSEFIYKNFSENNYLFSRFKEFEKSKASELLLSIAIISRSSLDLSLDNNHGSDVVVGILEQDNKTEEIYFRKTCNKIIHSNNIHFDTMNADSIKDGFLNPIVYLYGNEYGQNWKATIKIIDFCKQAFSIY